MNTFAGWEFRTYENDTEQSADELFFPIIFANIVCQFDFNYFDGFSFQSATINVPNCNSPKLVLDGYIYPIPQSMNMYVNGMNWVIYNQISLGNCSRLSGGNIPTLEPFLSINSNNFKLNEEVPHPIKNINNTLHFFFTSFHGDIKCSNGVRLEIDGDLIFKSSFENTNNQNGAYQ